MTSRIAIIPARGGSKRIPHKNIKQFCGKPMIAHVISVAQASGLFSEIHVSTDDAQIADVAKASNAEVHFMRPENLSDDKTPLLPVLKYVLEEFKKRGQSFDVASLLYATSPMISKDDLIQASYAFEKGNRHQPLLAVAPFPSPIEWAFKLGQDNVLEAANSSALSIRSQDLGTSYFDAAMFCFYDAESLLASDSDVGKLKFRGFPVSSERACDIDNEEDWVRAERMFKVLQSHA